MFFFISSFVISFSFFQIYLIVTDFESGDVNVKDFLKGKKIPSYVVTHRIPFSRSVGLSKAISEVRKLASRYSIENPKIFAIDCSIVLPENFIDLLLARISCGQMIFTPIAYKIPGILLETPSLKHHLEIIKENIEYGEWVGSGFGMIGFCYKDYVDVGGFNEGWGHSWGSEDVDLVHRFYDSGFLVHRSREPKYYHFAVKNYSSPYYLNPINIYERPEPDIDDARDVYPNNSHEPDCHDEGGKIPCESSIRKKHVQDFLDKIYGSNLIHIKRITSFYLPRKEILVVETTRQQLNQPSSIDHVYIIENRLRPIILNINEY